MNYNGEGERCRVVDSEEKAISLVSKYDHYTYYNCVSGNCPLIIEEEKYGIRTSTCNDYCGTGFGGCSTCYFEESDLCNECVHNVLPAIRGEKR